MSELTPRPSHHASFSLRRRALGAVLLAVALLALASLACSLGGALTGRGNAPTPTRTSRPTFTPLPGALDPFPTGNPLIRGTLPPGVAVPTSETVGGEAQATPSGAMVSVGGTNLILFATNTPTASPAPTQRPPTRTPRPGQEPTEAPPQPTPYVVISSATLNGRRGPGTNYERVGQASAGQSFFILGRTADSSWWQVCCMANQPVWVAADQVEAENSTAGVPVLTPPPTSLPPTPTRPVVAAPRTNQSPLATPVPAGTPLPPFDIARGPEFPIRRDNGLLTIWVKVYEGPPDNQLPLGGYILKVMRDGVDISDNLQSFGDRAFDETPPNQGGYQYNLKFERYDAKEADWEIYLARPGGFRVSPITRFTTKGDSYRNLVVFIAYFLAR